MGTEEYPVFFDVVNLEEKQKERIEKYFQIRRKSGGGESGQMEKVGPNTYKIAFKQRDAQERVLQRGEHVLETPDGCTQLCVRRRLQADTPPSHTRKGDSGVAVPPGVGSAEAQAERVWQLDPYLLRYLGDSPQAARFLQLQLTALGCSAQLRPEAGQVLLTGTSGAGQWEAQVDEVFGKVQDRYRCHYEAEPQRVAVLLQRRLLAGEGEGEGEGEGVRVYGQPGEGFAVLVGEGPQVAERLKLLQTLLLQEGRGDISSTCRLGRARLRLLWEELQRDLRELAPAVRLSRSNPAQLLLEGPAAQVRLARDRVQERAGGVAERAVQGVSPQLLSFLREEGSGALGAVLGGGSAPVEVELSDTELRLLSLSPGAVEEAQSTLLHTFLEEEVQLADAALLPLLKEALKAEELRLNQGKRRVGVRYRSSGGAGCGSVQLLGYRKEVQALRERLRSFQEQQETVEEAMILPSREVADSLSELLALLGLDLSGVQLTPARPPRPAAVLTGSRQRVAEVRGRVVAALGSVVQDELTLDQPGALRFFQGSGREYLQAVGRTHRCLIQLQGLGPVPREEGGASYRLRGGLCVRVRRGDITMETADALVNAANEDLEHCGGVAAALSGAGGPQVQQESRALVWRVGRVPTGGAVETGPGALPCRVLLHAVGPTWAGVAGDAARARELLESAVWAVLRQAEGRGCRSLAMPCISSGIFGVPPELCARAIVGVLRSFGETPHSLTCVTLLDVSEEVVRAMRDACDALLSVGSAAEAAGGGHASAALYPSLPPADPAAPASRVQVRVILGTVEDQKVDAVVSPMLGSELTSSRVGKCLKAKGGAGLVAAFERACRSGGGAGAELLQVDGVPGLLCRCVLFARCLRWDRSFQGPAVEALRRAVRAALSVCETRVFRSVAFPAIGTGAALGFPHQLVSRVLLEEIQQHEQNRVSAADFLILLVIHPSEGQSAAAFQASQHALNLSGFRTETHPEQASFYQHLSSNQNEVTAMVGGVKLQLVFGDIVRETTDVIVNSTDFSGHHTGVSKAILTAAGHSVQTELDRVRSPADGIFVSPAGGLSCQAIVHVCGQAELSRVRRLMGKVLKLCEQKGFRSVAFPAVCAGAAGLDCSAVSKAMLDGIGSAVRDSSFLSVSVIRIILLLQSVFLAFRFELECRFGAMAPSPTLRERGRQVWRGIRDALTPSHSVRSSDSMAMALPSYRPPPAVLRVLGPGLQEVQGAQTALRGVLLRQLFQKELWEEELQQLNPSERDALLELARDRGVSVELARDWGVSVERGRAGGVSVERARDRGVSVERARDRGVSVERARAEGVSVERARDRGVSVERARAEGVSVERARDRGVSVERARAEGVSVERGRVVLRGLKEEVLEVCDGVQRALSGALRRQLQEREQALVALSVQWALSTPAGGWAEVDRPTNCLLEQAFQRGVACVDIRHGPDGAVFQVQPQVRRATNQNTGYTCDVKRVELLTGFSLPACWDALAPGEPLRRVQLQPGSPEYHTAAHGFLQTCPQHNIQAIERVQNRHLWRAFWGKKQQLEEKNGPGQVGETTLFHGTLSQACDSIEKGGFNRSFAGAHVGARFGVGVYFAVKASYSAQPLYSPPDGAGLRYMYAARVLTGRYTTGKSGMRVPPPRSSADPNDRFDSLVDNVQNPNMFVIFHDDQAYPEYRITFK
ncbi:LOW QUALITY PROTEIN: protein mono-ADP-ribosyltransferase PARP14-like [Megalops cyprinoides]|uniref:LOW QUALITY PROTEIN: protein mono-ADP-ribosyltransferase PARP14-like n=1 Tax=Megalops cyprinoides TaxID=118141 RepID=UPI0018640083|nr:LOW QUALITY PROTEIN: protein mono-ADP-ribosyltransferase PARP14-like [Megalops cyprinoides]